MAKLLGFPMLGRLACTAFAVLTVVLAPDWFAPSQAFSQVPPTGLLAPGNAAVTGFSGAIRPISVPGDGSNGLANTRINPNGPALRIIDLQSIGGKLAGQYVDEPKPFTFNAALIGQVFAVALDNAVPPNIYVAATSAYGLPIVVRGSDNRFIHILKGALGAAFMPGLWGPTAQGGGPGSIWRIDGVTGAVTLFGNVTFNGAANPGPALGGLVYEPEGDSLLVADRWTGLIHRFRMDGSETATYDHGLKGRAEAGLATVPLLAAPLDITRQTFNSADVSTYGYAPPERRIFGLGFRAGRLYYAVASGLEIWSVALSPDGSFGQDARREFAVPPGAIATEISKITFDDQGRMFLAERALPTGAADFEALTPEGTGRVLRYAIIGSKEDGTPAWQPLPAEYAVGFPRELRNGNGGVALGYDYDATGHADRGVCGGFVWSTGEVLRHSTSPELTARLAASGPLDVNGLQGNWTWLTRPRNVPPLRTAFTDYDAHFDDGDARGHIGDLAIWRVCGPVLRGGWMIPDWFGPDMFADASGFGSLQLGGGSTHIPTPPTGGECPVDQTKPGFHCCPKGTTPDAAGQCKPYCPNGSTKPQEEFACALGFDTSTLDSGALKCIGGSSPVDGKGGLGCVAHSPLLGAPVCPAGYEKQQVSGVGLLCMQSKAQLQCAPGQQIGLDGQCHALCNGGTAWPVNQCCPANSVISTTGQCCPPGSTPDPKTGACKKPSPPPPSCPPGLTPDPKTGACSTPSTPPPPSCPPGSIPDPKTGACSTPSSPPPPSCPPGSTPDPKTGACSTPSTPPPPSCPPGLTPDPKTGACNTPSTSTSTGSQSGQTTTTDGEQGSTTMPMLSTCDPSHQYTDAAGTQQCCPQSLGSKGQCCPTGYGASSDGACCLASHLTSNVLCCPIGQVPGGPSNSQCVPSTPPAQSTPPGGQCCAKGSIPTASGVCCPAGQATSIGTCCAPGEKADARGTCHKVPAPTQQPTTSMPKIEECGTGQTMLNGSCCPTAQVSQDGQTCVGTTSMPMIQKPPVQTCPDGRVPDARGICPGTTVMPMIQMPPVQTCPDGRTPDARGNCPVVQNQQTCPDGRARDARGNCPVVQNQQACPDGRARDARGNCPVVQNRPDRPSIERPSETRPNGQSNTSNRPNRPQATSNHGKQTGVEMQIKRQTPPPPRIVGPKVSKPASSRPHIVVPQKPPSKLCKNGICR